MPIAYAAHTETCTFFLDDEGICRQIIRRAAGMNGVPRAEDSVSRCIGAQYVASIDVATKGGLIAMPKVGTPLLFAYIGRDGRIALVRTGTLLRFETKQRAELAAVADESIQVEVDVPLDELEDPTHLFRRAPAAAWNYDTSPPPPPSRRTVRPPAPLYAPPPPLPVHKVRVIGPSESAPTLEREQQGPVSAVRRGVLPARRRA
jgi:hypothetical protein